MDEHFPDGFEFGFDDDDDFDKVLNEAQIKDSINQMELEDATYQMSVLKEYGLETWFKASKFSSVDESIEILEWCMKILEQPDIEQYEDCATLRDSIEWLQSKSDKIKKTKDELHKMSK